MNECGQMKELAHSLVTILKLTFLAFLMSSCNEWAGSSIIYSDQSGQLEIQAPRTIMPRVIDPNDLILRVTVNGVVLTTLTPNANGIWRGETTIPEGQDTVLVAEWFERFNNRELFLAVNEQTLFAVSSERRVNLLDRDYVIDDFENYPTLDIDGDRIANLVERREDSDPTNAADPGATRANAFLRYVDPQSDIRIDGSFDSIWLDAQYQDRDDNLLSIDNRMLGNDPNRSDGNTEYRWAGMHDERFLYLYVLGANMARQSFGDSTEAWLDDSIDIFWDSDASRGDVYDRINDYHLIIPLLKLNQNVQNRSHLADGSIDPDGRYETGINSVPITEGVMFGNCSVCPGLDTYEVRLDMELLQIPIDRSFGFDVQINDDQDGGGREYKFGWMAPSAAVGANLDETWRDPSLMGLIQLVPAR